MSEVCGPEFSVKLGKLAVGALPASWQAMASGRGAGSGVGGPTPQPICKSSLRSGPWNLAPSGSLLLPTRPPGAVGAEL